ncbi:MAG: Mur ligase family protein [Thermoanaerobacteraceae bacterium]|nr:Mur ligase family protein [Thermoanaerobacteraceae bacterium]
MQRNIEKILKKGHRYPMAIVSIIGRGGKTTIKTMLEGVLKDAEVYEGITDKKCDLITVAGLARPLKKELLYSTSASMIVANADANYRFKIPYASEVIDYGFSRKATVTASSIIQDNWCQTFTCCIQRSIGTLNGNVVLPKEFTVKMNVPGKYNIYNALASISVLMLFDVKEEAISKTLSELKCNGNMERIYDGEFSIIYNKVSNPYQLFSVLESLSENEFRNIHIVTESFNNINPSLRKKIADVLQEWYSIYNYTLHIVNDGSGGQSNLMELLEDRNMEYQFDKIDEVIKDILNNAGKGDRIILLGSEKTKNYWADFFNIMKE